jgi:hypothetical protein
MIDKLNLRHVRVDFRDRARQAIQSRDGDGFVFSAVNRGSALALVEDNIQVLKKLDIYERCLLQAYVGCRSNNLNYCESVLKELFHFADASKLRNAGGPFPGPGPFRIYRGVAGTGRARRIKGFSWTGSLDIACWFATRFALQNPSVFTTEIPEEEVLAHVNERGEEEFLVHVSEVTRFKISTDEMQRRGKNYSEKMRQEKLHRLRLLTSKK